MNFTKELHDDLNRLDQWLDYETTPEYRIQPLAQGWGAIGKIAEELGETVQAFIGATGQNPRKGITHDIDDVLEELADVVFSALCAMQHLTKDADQVDQILTDKLTRLLERIHYPE